MLPQVKRQEYAEIVWKNNVNNSIGHSAPVIVGKEMVYFCSNIKGQVGIINGYKRFSGELSRPKDHKAVYVRSSRGTLYAVNVTNGALLFQFNVGPRLHSHPIHDLNDNTNIDKYWVSSNSGTLYHLTCPKDAHIVLNRIVYVCPELTIVEPTQNDLCNDLERPCVAVQKLKQLRKEGEWVSHKNLIN